MAVVNWRRRHGGLDASGGTEESPAFSRGKDESALPVPLAGGQQRLFREVGHLYGRGSGKKVVGRDAAPHRFLEQRLACNGYGPDGVLDRLLQLDDR
jgi:hypothetical protein